MTETIWIERKANEEVLQDVNEKWCLLEAIMKMEIKWIDRITRRYIFMKNIIENKILENKAQNNVTSKMSIENRIPTSITS